MGYSPRKKPLQFVADLVDEGVRELTTTGKLEEPSAREMMRSIARAICFRYGRQRLYIPADLEFELTQRDKEIWRGYGQDTATSCKFTPGRVAELADEYRLSTVHIYNVLNRMREIELAARKLQSREDQDARKPTDAEFARTGACPTR